MKSTTNEVLRYDLAVLNRITPPISFQLSVSGTRFRAPNYLQANPTTNGRVPKFVVPNLFFKISSKITKWLWSFTQVGVLSLPSPRSLPSPTNRKNDWGVDFRWQRSWKQWSSERWVGDARMVCRMVEGKGILGTSRRPEKKWYENFNPGFFVPGGWWKGRRLIL